MKQMLLGILMSFCISLSNEASAINSDKSIGQLLNVYYLQGKESLISQEIVNVAQAVVNGRKEYSQNELAKAFSLLSDVAFNRGNSLAALQFAQYGSAADNIERSIQLDLLLKVARGYYAQGQYIQLRESSQKAALLAEQAKNMNYHLQALAYSVVAHTLSADDALAVSKLAKIEHFLNQNQPNVDRITLLDIIADAHFNLAEYKNAVELLNNVLKLRTDMTKTHGIAGTYHLLAKSYFQLQRYDDAYNSFWQSLQFAKQYQLNIRVAYAELGLGQVLYQQQQFTSAKARLLNALTVFKQYNLIKEKLSTQISLVKVLYALEQDQEADFMLLSAQSLAENLPLSPQQIEIYLLLTNYYQGQNQLQQAIKAHKRYLTLYKGFHTKEASVKNALPTTLATASNRTKRLALNLAEQSQLSLAFSEKYHHQQMLILLLSAVLAFGIIVVIIWRIRLHKQRLTRGYDEIELPKTHLAQPVQTKRWYQQQYKIARKYNYPISVVYLAIENWQELSFHFNSKILADVSKALAVIINENIDEEDYAGVISVGEYLFVCPHQTSEQTLIKFFSIREAIETQFFANLGDHSVKVRCSIDSPDAQDIDPYVFLSHISAGREALK